MLRRVVWGLLTLFYLGASPVPSQAQLQVLETARLKLVYNNALHEFVAPHVARCFESALAYHENRFGYRPREATTVVLHDFSDYGNSGASAVPRNFITVGLAPTNSVYEVAPVNERMGAAMSHEVVHLVSSDQAAGADKFYRRLFGGKVTAVAEQPLSLVFSFLTTPRRYSPRWFHEGIAVQMETWMGGGNGRALGPFDEMVFRALVSEGKAPYDLVELESEGTAIDFQVGAVSYLYGTRFMSYLMYRYGTERLVAWVARRDSTARLATVQFRNVYGLTLEAAWNEWKAFETKWQQENLRRLRAVERSPMRVISDKALGSVSRMHFDPDANVFYAAVNAPGTMPHLAAMQIEDGRSRSLCSVTGASLYDVCSLAFDSVQRRLYFTSDNGRWRDLRVYDLATGTEHVLQRDARIGDLAFHPGDSTLWGVRHFNGISTLVRLRAPYREWNQVKSWPYGSDLCDIDISPDGHLLAAGISDIVGNHQLVVMSVDSLLSGHAAVTARYEFDNSIPSNFVFERSGQSLVGTASYSGVSNVMRYVPRDSSVQWLSHVETGLFRPVPVGKDSLLALHYTAAGFQPVMIPANPVESVPAIEYLGQAVVEKCPEIAAWTVSSSSAVALNLDSLIVFKGAYVPLRQLRVTSWYPVAEGYKSTVAAGVRVDAGDPARLNTANATLAVSGWPEQPAGERFHAKLAYGTASWNWGASFNATEFSDLFGPSKTSRKGSSISARHHAYLVYDEPRSIEWTAGASWYGGLERVPEYQQVGITSKQFVSINGTVTASNLQASLGAVDYEHGYTAKVLGSSRIGEEGVFPRLVVAGDVGWALPLQHSSLWLRGAGGMGFNSSDHVLGRFYFGGFGNNWIDYREIKRYREVESFPGVAINGAGGRSFVRGMLEWALPPLQTMHSGIPELYGRWIRPAMFASVVTTDVFAANRTESIANIGMQWDVRVVVLSMMDATLSVGGALAFREAASRAGELMVSLRVVK